MGCAILEKQGRRVCIPGGAEVLQAGKPAHCQDSLNCVFKVPGTASFFSIVDVIPLTTTRLVPVNVDIKVHVVWVLRK